MYDISPQIKMRKWGKIKWSTVAFGLVWISLKLDPIITIISRGTASVWYICLPANFYIVLKSSCWHQSFNTFCSDFPACSQADINFLAACNLCISHAQHSWCDCLVLTSFACDLHLCVWEIFNLQVCVLFATCIFVCMWDLHISLHAAHSLCIQMLLAYIALSLARDC